MKLSELLALDPKEEMKIRHSYVPLSFRINAVKEVVKSAYKNGVIDYYFYKMAIAGFTLSLFAGIEIDELSVDDFDKLLHSGLYKKIVSGICKSAQKDDYREFLDICDKTLEDTKNIGTQINMSLSQLKGIPKENIDALVKVFSSDKFQKDVAIREAKKNATNK